MARYHVVEVRESGTGFIRKIVSKNLTKGEATRLETTKNEDALKDYAKAQREGKPCPLVSYYASPMNQNVRLK